MRVVYVDDDYAQLTAEGDEIPEVLVHTAKVTRLVRFSNEQYKPDERGKPTGAVGFARHDPAGQSGVCG
jgi:hypothetical protein